MWFVVGYHREVFRRSFPVIETDSLRLISYKSLEHPDSESTQSPFQFRKSCSMKLVVKDKEPGDLVLWSAVFAFVQFRYNGFEKLCSVDFIYFSPQLWISSCFVVIFMSVFLSVFKVKAKVQCETFHFFAKTLKFITISIFHQSLIYKERGLVRQIFTQLSRFDITCISLQQGKYSLYFLNIPGYQTNIFFNFDLWIKYEE